MKFALNAGFIITKAYPLVNALFKLIKRFYIYQILVDKRMYLSLPDIRNTFF